MQKQMGHDFLPPPVKLRSSFVDSSKCTLVAPLLVSQMVVEDSDSHDTTILAFQRLHRAHARSNAT